MRATYQNRVIFEAVGELGTHPRAEDVYEHVIRQHPTISRATIFRNLNQLAQEGKLLNIGKIDGVTRYDHNCHPHYHFECKNCKLIFDMGGYLPEVHLQISCPDGFDVEEHVIQFRGMCKDCKNTE